ncbi:lysophospholipid acyltransferase family protein [Roseobacter fucihabitans]|nr:lysophospholipid acyltransferase family protein [Roseobacter litoralis]
MAIQWARLGLLVLLGPIYFIYIAFLAPMCRARAGFRGWFWRRVKRACSRMLWLLSIRCDTSAAARAALAGDENSIIVVNHRSHLDGFALMDVIPDQKWFTFGGKKELFDSFLLRRGFAGAGLVEIDRKSGKLALETMTRAVQEMPVRRSLLLFPEGTRAGGREMGDFKPGAVLIARATGRSIRPIVIMDADDLLPRDRVLPKAGVIRIEVLEAFHCDRADSVQEDVNRLHAAMRSVFEGTVPGL